MLSRYETLYDKANPFRRRHLATGRYVDDMILLSRTLCRDCVQKTVFCVYQNIAAFKVDEKFTIVEGETVAQTFLDAKVHFSFHGLLLSPLHKNIRFAWTGDPKEIAKSSIPPTRSTLATQYRRVIEPNFVHECFGGAVLPHI